MEKKYIKQLETENRYLRQQNKKLLKIVENLSTGSQTRETRTPSRAKKTTTPIELVEAPRKKQGDNKLKNLIDKIEEFKQIEL